MSLRLGRNEIVGQEEAATGRCNGCCGNRVRSKEPQGGAVVTVRRLAVVRVGSNSDAAMRRWGRMSGREHKTRDGDAVQGLQVVNESGDIGAAEAMGSADVATGGEEWLAVEIKEKSKAATDE
ncbi:hypothetical protein B296_00031994 [Ensete ventricosum]|uniref:Uncharacterized protein n=1 Tax=Ensete ventricosum TaxID=4639 RepID=A0A426XKR1_ENSVE|nr:hypothetical protein B296_00031994 [Ensete ventricosum]